MKTVTKYITGLKNENELKITIRQIADISSKY